MNYELKMKKIIFTILIILFTATATGNAQIFKSQDVGTEKPSGLNANTQDSNEGGGFFRSEPNDPGNRPGNGGGIGQEEPIKDGLGVLIACTMVFSLVKIVNNKRRRKFVYA